MTKFLTTMRSIKLGWPAVLACLLISAYFGSVAFGQTSADTNVESDDFAAELPRIDPLAPEDAIKLFETQPGFKVQLVASEPNVVDPVAVAWDASMRMYVVEMRGYSERDGENLGRIRLLEDKDSDGHYETSTVFADGLSWPTAIICFDGGVFVGAAPDIFYFKDNDNDGRADEKTKLFTGFGKHNVQGLLNSFRWGLDNRIHGATSSTGGEVLCLLEKRGREKVNLRGRDFSFDPREFDLRAEPGGAQHGMCFDDWGRKFVCSNSDHAQVVLYDDQYLKRNPRVKAIPSRISIAADGGQAPVFRASPVEPWRIVRTRLRVQGAVGGPVEGGGRPAGYFTGSTGITIYRGDAWPGEMSGTAIIGDVGSNIVHRKSISYVGTSFVATRIDKNSEFLRSPDIWFRPVQFANAPDGCLHVLDMYREVIEHPKSLPPEIKKHLDLNSGNDRGRIWRVAPENYQRRKIVDLSILDSADLVQLLAHGNSWHRETASRLLYQRQDKSIADDLRKLLRDNESPLGQLHAIYTLRTLELLTLEDVLVGLRAMHPRVREHTIKLSERFSMDADVAAAIEEFVYDADPRVRLQAAFSIGFLTDEFRVHSITNGLIRDGSDRLIRMALLSSASGIVKPIFESLVESEEFMASNSAANVLAELFSLADVSKQQMLDIVFDKSTQLDQQRAAVLLSQLVRTNTDLARLLKPHQFQIDKWVREAIAITGDDNKPITERIQAIEILTLSDFDSTGNLLLSLLNQQNAIELQLAGLSAIAVFDSDKSAGYLIENWNDLSPRVRSKAESMIAGRVNWSRSLLKELIAEKIPAGNVRLSTVQTLVQSRDAEVKSLARTLLAKWVTGSRPDVIAKYQTALTLKGDADAGKLVYQKQCANCHKFGDEGFEIGPDLKTLASRGRETILLNVLDPNREVNPQFLNWLAETADGKSHSGMIASETTNSIVLKRAGNETSELQRSDITQLTSTGMSLMPEGLEREIDLQSMADLLEFIVDKTVDKN